MNFAWMNVNYIKIDCKTCYIRNLLLFVYCSVHDDKIVYSAKKELFWRFWLLERTRNNFIYFWKYILFAFIDLRNWLLISKFYFFNSYCEILNNFVINMSKMLISIVCNVSSNKCHKCNYFFKFSIILENVINFNFKY